MKIKILFCINVIGFVFFISQPSLSKEPTSEELIAIGAKYVVCNHCCLINM